MAQPATARAVMLPRNVFTPMLRLVQPDRPAALGTRRTHIHADRRSLDREVEWVDCPLRPSALGAPRCLHRDRLTAVQARSQAVGGQPPHSPRPDQGHEPESRSTDGEDASRDHGRRCGQLEDVVEPYLLQIGFLARTPRGRKLTAAGEGWVASPGSD